LPPLNSSGRGWRRQLNRPLADIHEADAINLNPCNTAATRWYVPARGCKIVPSHFLIEVGNR
jgi:hypothetical protein